MSSKVFQKYKDCAGQPFTCLFDYIQFWIKIKEDDYKTYEKWHKYHQLTRKDLKEILGQQDGTYMTWVKNWVWMFEGSDLIEINDPDLIFTCVQSTRGIHFTVVSKSDRKNIEDDFDVSEKAFKFMNYFLFLFEDKLSQL